MRGVLGERADEVFEEHRSRQSQKKLLFSALAVSVADVVLGFAASMSQAFLKHRKALRVVKSSDFDKLNGTELAMVEAAAERASRLQDALNYVPWEPLAGYRVLSIDGNHTPASQKRLKVLRDTIDRPLAGTTVARFDHQRQLFDRAYL